MIPSLKWESRPSVRLALPRFAGRLADTLKQFINTCGYCGDSFSMQNRPKNRMKPSEATYDHIRPDSAGGNKTQENGVLACSPCNNRRSNVPLVEFLQGVEGYYLYFRHGTEVQRGPVLTQAAPKLVAERQKAFSQYLRYFVEQRIKPAGGQGTWFSLALDNLLFPVWKQGVRPADPMAYNRFYQQRIKEFLTVLAQADPGFWLGSQFENQVNQDFARQSMKRQALLTGIRQLRANPPQPIQARKNPFTDRRPKAIWNHPLRQSAAR